ncbi:hypothetical protein Micbo1qcDRAFT_163985, partial [Microdochium bolleyi]
MFRAVALAALAAGFAAQPALATYYPQDYYPQCPLVPAPNVLQNPSWESGLNPWQYSWYATGTDSDDASNGSKEITIPTGLAQAWMYQTVSGLTVGESYEFKVDWKGRWPSAPSGWERKCNIGIFHDKVNTNSAVVYKQFKITKSSNSWKTLKGTYKVSSASVKFIVYSSCDDDYGAPFYSRFDNAVLRKQHGERVCASTTSTTSTAATTSTQATDTYPVVSLTTSSVVTTSTAAPTTTSSTASSDTYTVITLSTTS